MTERIKPFTKNHVLRLTTKNMRRHIDVSIRKTFERVQDFDGNQEKSKEVFETLSILHTMRKNLDDFQAAFAEDFKQSYTEQSTGTKGTPDVNV